MSGHTPGPWFCYREGSRNPMFRDPEAYTIMQGSDFDDIRHTEHIAHCPSNRNSVATVSEYLHPAEANARLIAAAPELLELLKEARDVIYANTWNTPQELLNRIAATIAKAEGR